MGEFQTGSCFTGCRGNYLEVLCSELSSSPELAVTLMCGTLGFASAPLCTSLMSHAVCLQGDVVLQCDYLFEVITKLSVEANKVSCIRVVQGRWASRPMGAGPVLFWGPRSDCYCSTVSGLTSIQTGWATWTSTVAKNPWCTGPKMGTWLWWVHINRCLSGLLLSIQWQKAKKGMWTL